MLEVYFSVFWVKMCIKLINLYVYKKTLNTTKEISVQNTFTFFKKNKQVLWIHALQKNFIKLKNK